MMKFNERACRSGETPSSNFHASARGMGQLAACMANGGSWNGKQLLSESAF